MGERAGCGSGWGTPYSRSLAGVGGRLEGESECRESVGDIVGAENRVSKSRLSAVRGAESSGVVVGLCEVGEVLAWEVWTRRLL